MATFANSEGPELVQIAKFYQGLHCLLRQIDLQIKNNSILGEIITCDPSIHIMDHPHLTLWKIPLVDKGLILSSFTLYW